LGIIIVRNHVEEFVCLKFWFLL